MMADLRDVGVEMVGRILFILIVDFIHCLDRTPERHFRQGDGDVGSEHFIAVESSQSSLQQIRNEIWFVHG